MGALSIPRSGSFLILRQRIREIGRKEEIVWLTVWDLTHQERGETYYVLKNLPDAIPPFKDRIPLAFHKDGGFGKEVVVYYIGDGLLIIVLRLELEYNCGGMENYRGGEGLNFHLRRRKIASY